MKHWIAFMTLSIGTLLTSINIWQDWDFSEKQAILTYNAKLANNLGNLLNRALVLTLKLDLENWFENISLDPDFLKNLWQNFLKIWN